MNHLDDQQIVEISKRIDDALTTQVQQMLVEGSIDSDLVAVVASTMLSMAMMLAVYAGKAVGMGEIIAVAYALGKVSEREDWAMEYARQEEEK